MAGPVGIPVPYRWPPKHAHDITPRSALFADWVATVPGDALATVTAAVLPAGSLTVASVAVVGTTATVWLSGGTEGTDYVVVLTATTAPSGRVEDFPVQISVPPISTIL